MKSILLTIEDKSHISANTIPFLASSKAIPLTVTITGCYETENYIDKVLSPIFLGFLADTLVCDYRLFANAVLRIDKKRKDYNLVIETENLKTKGISLLSIPVKSVQES